MQAPAKQYLDILKDRHIKLKHAGWIQSGELLLASRNNQSAVFNRIVINNRAIILCRLPFGCFFKQLRKLYTHLLPESDVLALQQGVYLANEAELQQRLEDYGL